MVNPLKILNEGCQIIKDYTGFLLEFYWLMSWHCGYWKVVFPIIETQGSMSVRWLIQGSDNWFLCFMILSVIKSLNEALEISNLVAHAPSWWGISVTKINHIMLITSDACACVINVLIIRNLCYNSHNIFYLIYLNYNNWVNTTTIIILILFDSPVALPSSSTTSTVTVLDTGLVRSTVSSTDPLLSSTLYTNCWKCTKESARWKTLQIINECPFVYEFVLLLWQLRKEVDVLPPKHTSCSIL